MFGIIICSTIAFFLGLGIGKFSILCSPEYELMEEEAERYRDAVMGYHDGL